MLTLEYSAPPLSKRMDGALWRIVQTKPSKVQHLLSSKMGEKFNVNTQMYNQEFLLTSAMNEIFHFNIFNSQWYF